MVKNNQFNVLVVCALGQELQIVKSVLKWQIFQWVKIHYYVCGIGLEKSMISLSKYLSHSKFKFHLIINIWIAWYNVNKNNSLSQKWKLVQCLRVIQWDAKKELCVPPQYVIPDIDIVPLTSRYRVVRDSRNTEPFLFYDDTVVVDMEWYSIESVCDYFDYPRIFLKVLYDEIGKDSIKNYDDMLNTMKIALSILPELLRKIL